MARWKTVGLVGLFAVALLASSELLMAQQGAPGGRGGRGMGGRGFDPQQWRQRMNDRMKEALGASDEEWNIIAPRLEEAQTLSREIRRGGIWAMFAGRRGRPVAQPQAEQKEQTPLQKATTELQEALDDASTPVAQLKNKLTAYRKAREKARQKLAKAQEKLREVLSLRQEATLVLMGTLD